MATRVWRQQAITWTNVDLLSVRSSDIHLKTILPGIPHPSIIIISLKITYQKFHINFLGANELTLDELIFSNKISKLYLHFLSFLIADKLQEVKTLFYGKQLPTCVFTVKNIATDDLATQGARSSAAMVLTQFAQNIPTKAPEGVKMLCKNQKLALHVCKDDKHIITRTFLKN